MFDNNLFAKLRSLELGTVFRFMIGKSKTTE